MRRYPANDLSKLNLQFASFSYVRLVKDHVFFFNWEIEKMGLLNVDTTCSESWKYTVFSSRIEQLPLVNCRNSMIVVITIMVC